MTFSFDKEGDRCMSQLLFYRKSDKAVFSFHGESIPGVCSVTSSRYCGPWGKWDIEVEDGIIVVPLVGVKNRQWSDFVTSWQSVIDLLGLDKPTCKHIIRAAHPDVADRIDAIENFLAAHPDGQLIYACFGNPNHKQMRHGFWSTPKTFEYHGHVITMATDEDHSWFNPVIVAPPGLIVEKTMVYHTPGTHGGYFAVELLVAPALSQATSA